MRIIFPICPQTWFKVLPDDKKWFRIPEVCELKTYQLKFEGKKAPFKKLLNKHWGNTITNTKGGIQFTAFKVFDASFFEEQGLKCEVVISRSCCEDYENTHQCRHILGPYGKRKKMRIERYNQYKIDVLTLAKKLNFQLPQYGFALYFHFPIPDYWTKAKTVAFHGQPKLSKPDIDNCEKAFYDSLSVTDEEVAQLSGHGKYWFDPKRVDEELKNGYIEVLMNQPLYNPYGVTFIDQKAFDKQPKRQWLRRNPKKENVLV